MARTVERRTVTRVRHEGADQMKARITQIADEIGKVRDQAQQEAQALDKIRGMLDVGYLNDLLRSVEELETRLSELETDSLHAREGAAEAQRELEREQDRLAKLWDAYKIQEDELERLKRDYPLMEEKMFERDRQIDNLRRELSRLEGSARYKDQYEDAAAQNDKLRGEVDHLETELERALRTIEGLEGEVDSLRANEADAGRLAELESQLAEEQERLAKLYRVYEDVEAEKKDLAQRLADWETWFSRVRPSFEATGKAPNTAPH